MSRYEIAQTLKRLRAESGMTADQVGALIGKTGKAVNGWEHGRGQPDADTLIMLADIYGVDNMLVEFGAKQREPFNVSNKEKMLILAYRQHPEHQYSIDTLLGITGDK